MVNNLKLGWIICFDHTMIIAEDDPEIKAFQQMDTVGVAQGKNNPSYWGRKICRVYL